MLYHVTKQYGRQSEIPCGKFKTLHEAKSFIDQHIQSDAAMRIQVIYRIKEFDDVIEEFDSTKIHQTTHDSSPANHASGKNSDASFRPAPLQTGLKPKGMESYWKTSSKDDPEEK